MAMWSAETMPRWRGDSHLRLQEVAYGDVECRNHASVAR